MQAADLKTYCFEGFTLDLKRGRLRTGEREIDLRPKSFETLRYLVENAGRLVSKDELVSAIWPDVIVTDESLTRCVSEVRLALGDSQQRIIKTVPRRGYLFAASIDEPAAAAGSAEPSPQPVMTPPQRMPDERTPKAAIGGARRLSGWRLVDAAGLAGCILLAAGAGWWLWSSTKAPGPVVAAAPGPVAPLDHSAPTAPRLSIVVLPFANLSNDPEQEYFADGITDDLTTDLSRIAGSFVIAHNTAFAYKNKAMDVKQIGRELGVRYVLEGSVQPIGDTVRINAQLIDAESGMQLWADRFEGGRSRPADLQDEVIARLARALDVELINAESKRAQRERPNNPDAIDLTMRGWAMLNARYARENVEGATKLFEQALKINPDYTEALVGLARSLTSAVGARYTSEPVEQVLARADDATTRALAAAPDHAYAHYVKGEILRLGKQFDAAIAEYDTAVAIDRNLAPAYAAMGINKIFAGRAAEAFAPIKTAIRLSPRDPLLNFWLFLICHAHSHLGEYAAAIEWCRKSVAVSPFWFAYIDLAAAYAWTGQKEEAQAALVELAKLKPNYTVKQLAAESYSDNPIFVAQYQRIVEGARKAGLPEQ